MVYYELVIRILTLYHLGLTLFNPIMNGLVLAILYRKKFRQRPTTHFMRAIAFADTLMIYGWNLDHFLRFQFGFELDRLTVTSCKVSLYLNNSLLQGAAWFRVWLCADRFFNLCRVREHRRMHRHRNALALIVTTIVGIALVNLHLPIFTCYATANSTVVSANSLYYSVYPMWNYVNLAIYNLLPFSIMLVFDVRIVRHLLAHKRSSTVQQSRVQHVSVSVSIFLSAFLFCVMTTPATVYFAFLANKVVTGPFKELTLSVLDAIQYTYHSSSFVLYYVTLVEFRTEFSQLIRCRSASNTRYLAKSVAR